MKGENLRKDRLPKPVRLELLGVQELQAGEVTRTVRVRGQKAIIEEFARLTPIERGQVIERGMKATVV
jgi:hypothetical protein